VLCGAKKGGESLPRILLVDDERLLRSILSLAFTRAGYEVMTAADAFEAMALCNARAFDAMVADVNMPRMDGHELVRWIASNYPRIRCVLMSALQTLCDECPFQNQCTLLRKPFLMTDVVALINQMLSGRAD